MLTHADIWTAIDRLAQENSLSASGLARRAGLDPTTFNRSKRLTRDGKTRWPSTESIAKILEATKTSFAHFVSLVKADAMVSPLRTVPLTNLDRVRSNHRFDPGGRPIGSDWDEISLPEMADSSAFALEVTNDQFEPIYRDGDILIVSPATPPRRGDRVLVRTVGGDVIVRRLVRHTVRRLELQSLSGNDGEVSLNTEDVAFVARIIWATQ
jgi:phage repressor protein C with HTH and peptisase S24 domain